MPRFDCLYVYQKCLSSIFILYHLTNKSNQAKYAYRSIAEFIRHVTKYDEQHLRRNPFPELHRPPDDIPMEQDPELLRKGTRNPLKASKDGSMDNNDRDKPPGGSPSDKLGARNQETPTSDIRIYLQNETIIVQEATEPDADIISSGTSTTAEDDSNDSTQVSHRIFKIDE